MYVQKSADLILIFSYQYCACNLSYLRYVVFYCCYDVLRSYIRESNEITTVTIEEVYTKCQIRGPSSCVQDVEPTKVRT